MIQAMLLAQSDDSFILFIVLMYLVILVAAVVGMWGIFTKAGEPGWAAIIPIYNTYVLLKVVGKPWWWLILLLIPYVSIVFAILLMIELAKAFGKGTGFMLGLIFLGPIFIIILGFDSSQYLRGTQSNVSEVFR